MPGLFARHDNVFACVEQKVRDVEVKIEEDFDFTPRWQKYSASFASKKKLDGDARLAALRDALSILDNEGYRRSPQQQRFHEAFIAGCVRRIYGSEFESAMKRIMTENNWSRVQQEVCIITPRRFGKTYSVAMYAAAWAYSQSRTEVSIFSTGRRASKKLLRLVKEMIGKLPGGTDMIEMDNMEELTLRGPDDTIRKINSYPSKVETLKGMGGDLIICEEAAYMSKRVFFEVIVPLMAMKDMVLLCISTPLDSTNFYSKIVNQKDENGDHMVNVIHLSTLCPMCEKGSDPAACKHGLSDIPPWQAEAKYDRIREITKDEKDLFMQESMGLMVDQFVALFKPQWIENLDDRPLERVSEPVGHVFVSVDPNAGGTGSMMGVVSAYYRKGVMTVRSIPSNARAHAHAHAHAHTWVWGWSPRFIEWAGLRVVVGARNRVQVVDVGHLRGVVAQHREGALDAREAADGLAHVHGGALVGGRAHRVASDAHLAHEHEHQQQARHHQLWVRVSGQRAQKIDDLVHTRHVRARVVGHRAQILLGLVQMRAHQGRVGAVQILRHYGHGAGRRVLQTPLEWWQIDAARTQSAPLLRIACARRNRGRRVRCTRSH
jgi:hypothetical protein